MRVLLVTNSDWFLYNFKRSLARSLRDAGHEVILASPEGSYGPRLCEEGFRWESFALSRSGINPLAELRSMWRLHALYRALRPDVVHHFTIKCIIYGSIAARWAGVRHVVNSVTGLGFALLADTLKARLIRPVVTGLYRVALAGTDVVFQNVDNRDSLDALGALGNSRVCIIPGDGVDTAHFVPPAEQPQDVVLMMARLLRSKGVAEYVAAAGIVRQARPGTRFLLAGAPDPGNPESIDGATLDAWRREGAVELLGQRNDVLALQQSSSVAVLASTQGEGMPRSLLEAAACGRPLVATDVPGCRDLVVNGENGLLVCPGDAQALANAILALLADPERAARMGRVARARAEALYSDASVNGQTQALYALGPVQPAVQR